MSTERVEREKPAAKTAAEAAPIIEKPKAVRAANDPRKKRAADKATAEQADDPAPAGETDENQDKN